MKEMWRTLRQRLQAGGKDRHLRILLAVGLAGIALIALSEWLPKPAAEEGAVTDTPAPAATEQQVEQALEERITALLRAVEGVGDCRVMVTLESGAQSVYAADTAASAGADGSQSSSENTLMVETADGPVGLLLTRIQPTVKGVAVVCGGADDPAVCQRVVDVVTTAFHISERRVCVVKQQ